jgi:predicted dehydrogenase
MLADPDVEVVHIASPNNLHARQTIEAAEAGKHVLCEKPMALTVEDCELMIKTCKKNRVKLGVGFQNRHHMGHQEARRIIASGEAGNITLATAQFNVDWINFEWSGWRADPQAAGAGSLAAMGVHCIDLLRFLLGDEIEEVSALSDTKWNHKPLEDMILVNIKFENGPFASVVAGLHVAHTSNDIVIYGTKLKIIGENTIGMPLEGQLRVTGEELTIDTVFHFPNSAVASFVRQAEAFNKAIDEDSEPSASGEDGLEVTRVTSAILESANRGQSVRIKR